jgi:hypothetical protein
MSVRLAYFHILFYRYRGDAAAVDARMEDYFGRFRREVPGVVDAQYGRNLSGFARDYTHLRLTAFESYAAHMAYQVAALHDEIAAYILPRADVIVGDCYAAIDDAARPRYYHVILMQPKGLLAEDFWSKVEQLRIRLREETPGARLFEIGPSPSPYGAPWRYIHLSGFESRAAHDAYQSSALHSEIVDLMVPAIDAQVGDLEAR